MEKEESSQGKVEDKRSPLASLIVTGVGVVSVVVLLAPSAIPDIIPFFGALDEAAATAMLISCLAYFGVDIGALFGRRKKKDGDVIDVEAQDE